MAVTITCYGKTEMVEDVQEAVQFYMEGVLATEGAERARYLSIVRQLKAGIKEIDDTNPEYNPYY